MNKLHIIVAFLIAYAVYIGGYTIYALIKYGKSDESDSDEGNEEND